MSVRWALVVVAVTSCGGSAADHRVLGDRAYVAGRFDEALAEYRLALRQRAPNATLRAKAATSAARIGELKPAIEEYIALAREDEERAGEAADGLERVARLALVGNDLVALRLAIGAIRDLGVHRPVGGTFALALLENAGPGGAVDLLPLAAAAAPDARAQDSLMYEYGTVLRRTGRCEQALPVLESLARRRRVVSLAEGAARDAASCALTLGRRALNRNAPTAAEEWFRRAVTHAGDTPVGRAAYVGLGDVMFARGEFQGAVEAFQRAMADAPAGDSIAAIARDRLNLIGSAGTVFR